MHNKMAPDYIKDFTSEFNPDKVDYFTDNMDWFGELMFKGQLNYDGEMNFTIFYSGTKYEDGLIATENETPLIVWGQPVNHVEKILLFDERTHGFTANLIEEKDFSEPDDIRQYDDNNGEKIFRVYLWTNSSVDFEDEFKLNEDGQMLTLNGSYKSLDYLRKNAFDYIGILLKNSNGNETRIVDMELA